MQLKFQGDHEQSSLWLAMQQATKSLREMQSRLEAICDLRAKAARTRDRQKAAKLLAEADEQQLLYECCKRRQGSGMEVCSPFASSCGFIKIPSPASSPLWLFVYVGPMSSELPGL